MYLALGMKMMLIALKRCIWESFKITDGEEGSKEFTVIHRRRSPSCFMFYMMEAARESSLFDGISNKEGKS